MHSQVRAFRIFGLAVYIISLLALGVSQSHGVASVAEIVGFPLVCECRGHVAALRFQLARVCLDMSMHHI